MEISRNTKNFNLFLTLWYYSDFSCFSVLIIYNGIGKV